MYRGKDCVEKLIDHIGAENKRLYEIFLEKPISLKLLVGNIFGQKLCSHFFQILTFSYQSHGNLKIMYCNTFNLIFAKFDLSTIKRPSNRISLKMVFQIKFTQKLLNQFCKKLTFYCQSRVHLEMVHCSSSSLMFARFDLSTKKRP